METVFTSKIQPSTYFKFITLSPRTLHSHSSQGKKDTHAFNGHYTEIKKNPLDSNANPKFQEMLPNPPDQVQFRHTQALFFPFACRAHCAHLPICARESVWK